MNSRYQAQLRHDQSLEAMDIISSLSASTVPISGSVDEEEWVVFSPAATLSESGSQVSGTEGSLEIQDADEDRLLISRAVTPNFAMPNHDGRGSFLSSSLHNSGLNERINEWQLNQSYHLLQELLKLQKQNRVPTDGNFLSSTSFLPASPGLDDSINTTRNQTSFHTEKENPAQYWGITDDLDLLSDDFKLDNLDEGLRRDLAVILADLQARPNSQQLQNSNQISDERKSNSGKKTEFWGKNLLKNYNPVQIKLIKAVSKDLSIGLQEDLRHDLQKHKKYNSSNLPPLFHNNTDSSDSDSEDNVLNGGLRTVRNSFSSTISTHLSPMVWRFTRSLQQQDHSKSNTESFDDMTSTSSRTDKFWENLSMNSSMSAEVSGGSIFGVWGEVTI